ncbi:MAG: hypothetical protein FWH15_09755 [Betaproteobacteria bacterium]|nr:hypothetical protein [Betaproteobacteria bacterium]
MRGVDLLSEDCPIRYIITINALKEGWDCPFAYVLATIANRSSAVDVEQILGCILRLPHTRKNENMALNVSYAITSSNNFQTTLARVVAGLNNAGFSDDDYRIGEEPATETPSIGKQVPITMPAADDDDDAPVDVDAIKAQLGAGKNAAQSEISADSLLARAIAEATQYENVIQESGDHDAAPLDTRKFMNMFALKNEFADEAGKLRLPQFVVPQNLPSFLVDEKTALLSKEALTEGFTLLDKDTRIDFSTIEAEIARVDIEEDARLKAWKLKGADNQFFREWFNSLPTERRIGECKSMILSQLSKDNAFSDKELAVYVGRVIDMLATEQMDDLQQSPHIYFAKIKDKINALLQDHREETFILWTNQGKITCEPQYRFKESISPVKFMSIIPKSLYAAEEEMNEWEKKVVWELANMENTRWWHRNISQTGFHINGYVHAFPDIISMAESGKILIVEPKGGHLANKDSEHKAKAGRAWENVANKAGDKFRYYMVFPMPRQLKAR